MVIIKNNYYLYIENIKEFNVTKLKINKKINLILRNVNNNKISEIINYRLECKSKKIKFFIANNVKLAIKCKADGLYISAHNKKKYYTNIPKIGSAHNLKEIKEKQFQKCDLIIYSRLFKTQYQNKKSYLGVIKFNLLSKTINRKLIPLGGINSQTLLKLNLVKCDGFACLSGIKKKPTISSRLF